jgi:hypothetical protein
MSLDDQELYDDSDDPLAPHWKSERLVPVKVELHQRESPKQKRPSQTSAWLKKGPSQSDRSILGNLDPNRPDLADEGAATVLDVGPNSSPISRGKKEGEKEEADLDDLIFKKMMQEKDQEKKQEEIKMNTQRALGLMPSPLNNDSPPLGSSRIRDEKMPDAPKEFPVPQQPNLRLNEKAEGLNIKLNIVKTESFARPSHKNDTAEFLKPPLTAIPRTMPVEPDSRFRRHSTSGFGPITGPFHSSVGNHHVREPSTPGLGPSVELLQSPVGNHILREPPTPEHILRPIQMQGPNSPPALLGPASPHGSTLPSGEVKNLLKDADVINHRQRQNSMGAVSSVTALSPPFPFSGQTSPFFHSGQSPHPSHDESTSPREWTQKQPMSAATSPAYSAVFSPFRRASHATEPFPSYNQQSTASDSYSTSPDAISPETQNGTNITTPSERSVIIGHDQPRPAAPLRQAPAPLSATAMGPPHHSPLAETSPRSATSGSANGMTNAQLLPAFGSGQVSPTRGVGQPQGTGVYRCDHPGCDSQPFHTQYLLKYIHPYMLYSCKF